MTTTEYTQRLCRRLQTRTVEQNDLVQARIVATFGDLTGPELDLAKMVAGADSPEAANQIMDTTLGQLAVDDCRKLETP